MTKHSTAPSSSKAKKSKQKTTKGVDSTTKKKNPVRSDGEVWSKSKKKRMRKLKAKTVKQETNEPVGTTKSEESATIVRSESDTCKKQPSALINSFQEQLKGSRFRILNEELYTTHSAAAFQRFSRKPELYSQYHEGFRYQVEKWPVNPIHVIVKQLIHMADTSNPTSPNKPIVVADFGCGDAELAKRLMTFKMKGKCPFQVHSFDLVAESNLVTACDMANVPLPEASVDVGIFCLSLMGTNLADFIREAHRILKPDGKLKIAEVRSRFENKAGKEDLDDFIAVLGELGFQCVKIDRKNKMFVLLELDKNGKAPKKDVVYKAKPCIYKRR